MLQRCSMPWQYMTSSYDTETLQAVLQHDAAGLARALCTSFQTAPPVASSAETATMTGIPVLTVAGTQTTLTGDVVDTSTAEAMIAEALRMVDDTTERERLAVMRARSWEERMELATSLLKAEENRTDRSWWELEASKGS